MDEQGAGEGGGLDACDRLIPVRQKGIWPMSEPQRPYIDRKLEMNFVGDWGWANIHKVCGWLGAGMLECAAPGSRYAIWSTRYVAAETVRMVGRGDYDLAFSTPAAFVENAVSGVGVFEGEQYPDLVAIGTFPQTDSIIFAVDAALGLRTFEDIRRAKPALHIATNENDGDSFIGFAAHEVLRESGISPDDIRAWGGSFVERDPPDQCCEAVRDGVANAIFYEAVMTPYWRNLAKSRPLSFIPVEADVLARLKQKYHWSTNIVKAGALEGLDRDLEAINWSDWMCFTRKEFPDDVAYALAWVACNTSEIIERQYRHLPVEISPLTYPIRPEKVVQTSIPLHPGAARCYRDLGYLA
jgi:TRAP-type uncharacterized transport system substrate-binding protein